MTTKIKLLITLGIILIAGGIFGNFYFAKLNPIVSLNNINIEEYSNENLPRGSRYRRNYEGDRSERFKFNCFGEDYITPTE